MNKGRIKVIPLHFHEEPRKVGKFSLDCLAKIRESVCVAWPFSNWSPHGMPHPAIFRGCKFGRHGREGNKPARESKNISLSRLLLCCLQTYGAPPALAEQKGTLWKLPLEQYMNWGQIYRVCVCTMNSVFRVNSSSSPSFFPPPALPLRRLEVKRREE